MKRRFSVPFISEITEIYEVEADSKTDATMLATIARQNQESPTHHHVTKFKLGIVNTTVLDREETEAVTELPREVDIIDGKRKIKDNPQA